MPGRVFVITTFIYLLTGCGEATISSSVHYEPNGSSPGDNADINITVDSTKNRLPISPLIFGTNNEHEVQAGVRLYRIGGSRWSTFNWENNASNAGTDYGHYNGNWLCIIQNCSTANANKPGEVLKLGINRAFNAQSVPLVTIPIGPFVAADKTTKVNRSAAEDILPWRQNYSTKTTGSPSANPNVNDDAVYQEEALLFVKNQFPVPSLAGQIHFMLDNEPGLWASRHPYAHANPATYADTIAKTIEFGSLIKRELPQAKVYGGVAHDFNELRNLKDATDKNLGDALGKNFFEYFLYSLKNHELTSGEKVIDVIDLHWSSEARAGNYKISNEEALTPNTTDVIQARLQAPRSLWDPTYVETSGITNDILKGPITLIPRLRQMINRNYPGIKISFSEYAHGGENHISGALAQVDTLGIFAREGVYAAAHRDRESSSPYIYGAIRLFTDYDGQGSSVGDTSVLAITSDSEKSSAYAIASATDDRNLSLILINKTENVQKAKIALNAKYEHLKSYAIHQTSSPVEVPFGISPGDTFSVSLLAMSATLFVLRRMQ